MIHRQRLTIIGENCVEAVNDEPGKLLWDAYTDAISVLSATCHHNTTAFLLAGFYFCCC